MAGKAGARNRSISPNVRKEVWLIDEGKCVFCQSEQGLQFDHVYPHSKGGLNSFENIQLLCGKCNRTKTDRVLSKKQRDKRNRMMMGFVFTLDPAYCVLMISVLDESYRTLHEINRRLRDCLQGVNDDGGLFTTQKIIRRLNKLVSLDLVEKKMDESTKRMK